MNIKKLFVSLMLVVLLCGTSQADIVYTTSTGNLGIIKISRGNDVLNITTPSVGYSGLGANSLPAPYWDGTNARLIVIERTTDITTSSGDTALTFNTANLSSPLESERIKLGGAYNIQSAVSSYNGRGLFTASRENASIIEFMTENFTRGHSYTYKPKSGDFANPEILSVLCDVYSVYGLVSADTGKSLMLRFDGQLKDDIEDFASIEINHNASTMGWLSNSRIALAHSEGVDVLNDRNFVRLLSTDKPVKTFCADSSNGLYFVTQALSGDVYNNTLYHCDMNTEEVTALRQNEGGSNVQTVRDDGNNALAVIINGKILIYDMQTDILSAEFNSDTLGGLPMKMSITAASGDDGHRSSGCNISGIGIILLALLLKKK